MPAQAVMVKAGLLYDAYLFCLPCMISLSSQAKMIYAYIRISTDKQIKENQRFEIEKFAESKGLKIDLWVSEQVTGTKSAKERRLGPLLRKMKKGDTLVISEISRLGRNLMSIMSMLNLCMTKETFVLTVKEKYELGNNINSQVLAFAFGLSAQIERDLISQRTKEALAWRKASGKKLGRQAGEKNTHYKLDKKAELIDKMLAEGKSKAAICRKLKCHLVTLNNHLIRMEEKSCDIEDY